MHTSRIVFIVAMGISSLMWGMYYSIGSLTIGGRLTFRFGTMRFLRYDAHKDLSDWYTAYGATLIIAVSTIIFGNALFTHDYLTAVIWLMMILSASWATGSFGTSLQRGDDPIDRETTTIGMIAVIMLSIITIPYTITVSHGLIVAISCCSWVILLAVYQHQGKTWHQVKNRILFVIMTLIAILSILWWGCRVLLQQRDQLQADRLPTIQHIYHILPSSTPTPYLPNKQVDSLGQN